MRACGSRLAIAAGAALLAGSAVAAIQPPPASARWITAWATSQQALGTATVTNATVRMIARVTIPGEAVRVRIDNTFGAAPLVIGKAYVGQRIQGAALAAGSNRQVMFNRSASATVPAGGSVTSDPVPMHVLGAAGSGRQPLHSRRECPAQPAHRRAGDVVSDRRMAPAMRRPRRWRLPFTGTTTSMFWLKAIDVSSSASTGSIVAFGDSITDGTCSTLDAHDRWEDLLAMRLALDAGRPRRRRARTRPLSTRASAATPSRATNLQPPADSPPGIERLDRDVLTHHGVTHVILFMGTNDVRREAPPHR